MLVDIHGQRESHSLLQPAYQLQLLDAFGHLNALRAVLTSVNRQPAVAFYLWRTPESAYLPLTVDVLRVTDGAITEIVTFHDDQFPRLGLPERLPAD